MASLLNKFFRQVAVLRYASSATVLGDVLFVVPLGKGGVMVASENCSLGAIIMSRMASSISVIDAIYSLLALPRLRFIMAILA